MSLNELAVNLRQGQSLVDALKQTASKTNNAHLKSVWEEVLNDVLQGKSLSRAMAAHPEVFPPNLLAAVQQGERQGNLDVALLRYAGR
jgi:type II secretory pathway component PulF